MMKQNKSGSVVLVVVLVMAAIILWCLNALKSFSLTMEMALKRQKREQMYKITEGVLRYGLWLCKTRFKRLEQSAKKGATTYVLDAGIWELKGIPSHKGQLDLSVKDKVIDLKASLLDGNACTFGMECQLARTTTQQKKEQKRFVIRNWKAYG